VSIRALSRELLPEVEVVVLVVVVCSLPLHSAGLVTAAVVCTAAPVALLYVTVVRQQASNLKEEASNLEEQATNLEEDRTVLYMTVVQECACVLVELGCGMQR